MKITGRVLLKKYIIAVFAVIYTVAFLPVTVYAAEASVNYVAERYGRDNGEPFLLVGQASATEGGMDSGSKALDIFGIVIVVGIVFICVIGILVMIIYLRSLRSGNKRHKVFWNEEAAGLRKRKGWEYDKNADYDENAEYDVDEDAGYEWSEEYDTQAGYGEAEEYDIEAGYGEAEEYDAEAGYGGVEEYDIEAGYAGADEYDAETGYKGTMDAEYEWNTEYNENTGYDEHIENGGRLSFIENMESDKEPELDDMPERKKKTKLNKKKESRKQKKTRKKKESANKGIYSIEEYKEAEPSEEAESGEETRLDEEVELSGVTELSEETGFIEEAEPNKEMDSGEEVVTGEEADPGEKAESYEVSDAAPEQERELPVIKVDNVTMKFKVATGSTTGLKDYVIQKLKNQITTRDLLALDAVSFEVFKGEVVGIIGTNGSGKSTLLKIVSGAMKPTSGQVIVDISKIQLLTLGTGFDMELSARENVYLNGAIIGYPKEFINDHYDEIVAFAELEGFMDTKVKNFSSGMVSRLGFAIATAGDAAEILILDEVLSVGDEFFRKKSLKRIKEMIHGGSTVIMVSHGMGTILENCTKVVWIEKGVLQMVGDAETVCGTYQKMGKS